MTYDEFKKAWGWSLRESGPHGGTEVPLGRVSQDSMGASCGGNDPPNAP